MKKLFTLTMLLLCAVVGAKAEEVTLGRTLEFSSTPTDYTLLSDPKAVVTLDDGTGKSGKGKGLYYKTTATTSINAKCYRSLKADGSTVLSSYDADCYAGVKIVIATGYKVSVSKVLASVAPGEKFDYKLAILDEKGVSLYTSATKSIGNYNKTTATNLDFEDTPSSLELTGTVYLHWYYWYTAGKGSNSKYIAPLNITLKGELVESTSPTISFSPNTITLNATESGVAVNSSFTITGSNLTAGTYNLNVPSIAGLSISPTSFTVASDGTVNQTVSVSYSSTENVSENTANITATIGELQISVAVTYSASVNLWTLQTINSEKVWDFSKVSGGVQYTGDDRNTEHVYANISELTFDESFDATALAFMGEYPLRPTKTFAQNGTLHFKSSVPGTIVVKFSDTGSSASSTAVKRYLIVNGEQTEYWASRQNNGTENPYEAQLNVTTDAIFVPAGDVTIAGSSALIYTYLSFTPVTTTTVKIDNGKGYRTFASKYPLDFTTSVDGLTAYIASVATVEGKKVVKFTKVEGTTIPAGEGLLLKGNDNTYTIPVASSAATIENALIGVTKETVVNESGIFVLMAPESSPVGFYKTTATSFTVGANTAYLPASVAEGRAFIGFADEPEATGINEVKTMKASNDIYNLKGQRVEKAKKGLYIIGGKKVVMK